MSGRENICITPDISSEGEAIFAPVSSLWKITQSDE